jgi:RND family efflux transporter MFP subunit
MRSLRFFPIVLLLLLINSCTEGQREWLGKFFKVSGKNAVPVTVEQVQVQERTTTITVAATLAPSDQVQVSLPYEAHIERVFANIGDPVKAGTVLCRLSIEDTALRLAALRAEAREAQSTLERNQYVQRNKDALLDNGRIDRNQYDNIETEVSGNEAALDRLRAQISQLEAQTGSADITSPIAGIVQGRNVSAGIVIPERQPLFSITKVDPMNVVFSLAPYEATAVKPQMPVNVRLRELPGEKIPAVITSAGSAINLETSRFDVTAQIANPNGAYKIGMIAQVEFSGAQTQKYFNIPEEAVISENRRTYVFTVAMGNAHRVPVVVRGTKDGYAEIMEGLVEGDLVVVKGNKQLKEGSVVDIWGR